MLQGIHCFNFALTNVECEQSLTIRIEIMKKKYVFISYSRKDTKFAKRIAEDLRRYGFNVWMDQSNIPGGRHWDNDIETALKNSFVVVLIVSPASVVSENVKDEIAFAKNRNIHIIPAIYQEAETPLGWDRLQWVELHKDYDSGVSELAESISGVPIEKPVSFNFKKVFKILLFGGVVLLFISLLFYVFSKGFNSIPKQIHSEHIKSTNIYKGNLICQHILGHIPIT